MVLPKKSRKKAPKLAINYATAGSSKSQREVLGLSGIRRQKNLQLAERSARVHELTRAQRLQLHALQQAPPPVPPADDNDDYEMMDDILGGQDRMNVSHEGGEFGEILDRLTDEYREAQMRRPGRRRDWRTRRDRTQRRVDMFKRQLPTLVEAYMDWSSTRGVDGLNNLAPYQCEAGAGETPQKHTLNVVDIFWRRQQDITVTQNDATVAAAIIRNGLIPVAPVFHSFAITTRTLEMFRVARLRCPQLSIDAFVKSLGDIHLAPPRSTLKTQFSIAFDIYEDILLAVDKRVQQALGRDDVHHRIKNACPCCMYELDGEDELIYRILFCMDGNDSLKRIFRSASNSGDENLPPESRERLDDREDGSDYFLAREKVDAWAKERLSAMLGDLPVEEELNLCEDRWENMKNDMVSRMWGIFEETGLFLALCRHGFVLVGADMIRSGELAKYPLAIVEYLLDTLGSDLGGGYDIGCKFGITLKRAPVLGKLAQQLRYTSLVGLFHGYAHNRYCQTCNLPTYKCGCGLEDFEGCEREFSRTNAVAGVTRYATRFHRRRLIAALLRRTDMDTYERLSIFLVNNYRQALDVLANKFALEVAKKEKGVASDDDFIAWLAAERKHLEQLKREPPEETLQMEYLAKLKLHAQYAGQLDRAKDHWNVVTPDTIDARDYTNSLETARRHTQEKLDRALDDVQTLEVRLKIVPSERWTPASDIWETTEELLRSRTYRRALDVLEGLVVARLFELTKMNQSQTGYKLRKHIANALKTRSQAIRTALEKYNAAANEFRPPRPNLNWDQVVEYAFLSEFDLLRESRSDIRREIWAQPWARILMDQYFKMERAKEEIKRLNIEIRRLITYIQDEDAELERQRLDWVQKDSRIAFQIDRFRQRRARFNARHLERLSKLSLDPGFSGTLRPGVRASFPTAPNAPIIPPSTAPLDVPTPTARGVESEADDVENAESTHLVPGDVTMGETTENEAAAAPEQTQAKVDDSDDEDDDEDDGALSETEELAQQLELVAQLGDD